MISLSEYILEDKYTDLLAKIKDIFKNNDLKTKMGYLMAMQRWLDDNADTKEIYKKRAFEDFLKTLSNAKQTIL